MPKADHVALESAWAMLIGCGVLISLIGWGSLISRLGRWHQESWAVAAGFGFVVLTLAGGALNLVHGVSRTSCWTLLAIGGVLGVHHLWQRRSESSGPATSQSRILWWVAAMLLALHYAGWAWNTDFNLHDDFHAYLVFPHRMLDAGGLDYEPFSERRVVSSLGGLSFLHAIILSLCTEPSVTLMDPAIPYLILAGLAFEICRSRQLPSWTAPSLVIAVCLTPIPRLNSSCVTVGLCCFFLWLLWLDERGTARDLRSGELVMVGLLLASICSLKNNLTPAIGLSTVAWLGVRAVRLGLRPARLIEAAVTGGVAFAVLAPWWVVSLNGTNTAWFPWLGRGVDISAHGGEFSLQHTLHPLSSLKAAARFCIVPTAAATAGALLYRFGLQGRRALDMITISVVALLAAGEISTIATDGYSPNRFSFAYIYAALLVLTLRMLAEGVAVPFQGPSRILSGRWIPWLFLSLPLVAGLPKKFVKYNRPHEGLRAAFANERLDPPQRRQAYATLLSNVPPDEPVLLFLDRPCLVDYRHRTAWLCDYPGNAGPLGKFPLSGDPVLTEEYLVANGVRFLAYSYGNQGNLGLYIPMLTNDMIARLMREQAERAIPWLSAFDGLVRSRPRIHDDGSNAVVRLRLPAENAR